MGFSRSSFEVLSRPVFLAEVAAFTLLAFACSSADNNGVGTGLGGNGGTGSQGTGSAPGTGSVTGSGTCGNGTIETGEECDSQNLNGGTCASVTLNSKPTGVLGCNPDCTYNTSGCTTSGNGTGSGGSNGSGGSTSGAGGTGSSTGGTPGTGGVTGTPGSPTALPTHQQTCPSMVTGNVTFLGNTVTLWAGPSTASGGPIVLYWHGTGTSSQEAVTALGQGAINQVTSSGGVIASFQTTTAQGTNTGDNVWYTGDFTIADEIVACAIEQLHADPKRIHSAGYSAGGLQTGTMAFLRSGYIASVLIYSGGAILTTPNQDPNNVPATLCAHGAPGSDVFILDFAQGCTNFETSVKQRGGFSIDCNDGSNHIDITTRMAVAPEAWQFLMDHPFEVKPEPYTALPSTFPSYCSIY